MTSWLVTLDPPAVATNRTQLNLNSGAIQVGGPSNGTSIDWGDSHIEAFQALQQFGSAVVDYRVPNRTVTIPLGLGMDSSGTEETARSQLREMVALLQREGGWLLRQRAGGSAMYADIVNATLTLPDVWGETGGLEPNVNLVLECLPDFYGDEVTLDTLSATGCFTSVLTVTGTTANITGDIPVRTRILASDTSGHNQLGALWGIRCKHYDSASSAALVYEADTLGLINGTVVVTGVAGATNSKVAGQTNLPAGAWVSVLTTTPAVTGTPMSHQGSYHVWARCQSPAATPQLQFLWGVGSLSVPVTNSAVKLPGAGAFYLMDLGEIRLDPPPTGPNEWFGAIQVQAANAGDAIYIDQLYFQPIDDGAGQLEYVAGVAASSVAFGPSPPTSGTDNSAVGTVAWGSPGNVTSEDGNVATPGVMSGIGTATHYLQATGFGFAIPAGATITGIQVDVKRGGSNNIVDNRIRLVKTGAIQTPDKADTVTPWPVSLAFKTYGGQADLWSGAWTPSDINSANFGVVLSAQNTLNVGQPNVDFIRVTVYCTLASGFSVSQDAVVYASKTAELRWDGMWRVDPTGTVYGPISDVIGDLPRIPPSGLEGRPVQLFFKPTRGDLNSLPDSGLDGMTIQVKYRPCWIGRP